MSTFRKVAAYVRANADVFGLLLACALGLTAVATATDSFTSAGTFWASGPVGAVFPKPGLYTTSSSGAGYFVNQHGVNSGGFVWTNTSGSGFGTQLMLLDSSGALHVSQVVGNAFTSAAWQTAPSNCPVGEAPTGTDAAGNAINCRPTSACVTSDECGEVTFVASQTSNTYTFTGTPLGGGCAGCFSQHPICTSNLSGAQNAYTYPNYGGCGGSPCNLTIKTAAVGVTASADYICRIRP